MSALYKVSFLAGLVIFMAVRPTEDSSGCQCDLYDIDTIELRLAHCLYTTFI